MPRDSASLRGSHWGNAEQRAERQARALKMRLEGLSMKAIAEEIGVSMGCIWNWCKQYTDQCKEEAKADAWRILMRDWEITEAMIDGLLEKATSGNPRSCLAMIRLLERRSKYRGLDAATKVEVNAEVIPNRDEFDSMVLDVFRRVEQIEQMNKASIDDTPALGELQPDGDDD